MFIHTFVYDFESETNRVPYVIVGTCNGFHWIKSDLFRLAKIEMEKFIPTINLNKKPNNILLPRWRKDICEAMEALLKSYFEIKGFKISINYPEYDDNHCRTVSIYYYNGSSCINLSTILKREIQNEYAA